MFFTKNEIIELEDKNYFIIDMAVIDNEAYYKVSEVNLDENTLEDEWKYVTAIKESSTLYIEEVNDPEIIEKLNEKLKS
ncbi:MAG: hypothetical protein PHF21_03750 [Bacilli bacterium]|nr:hypothetical protein [Bacilli bacterium]